MYSSCVIQPAYSTDVKRGRGSSVHRREFGLVQPYEKEICYRRYLNVPRQNRLHPTPKGKGIQPKNDYNGDLIYIK